MAADPVTTLAEAPFSGSYAAEDVTFLLKPVALDATDVADKEALIQSGRRHYSEMIAPEAVPGDAYLSLYDDALARNGERLAGDIASLAAHLVARRSGRPVVIASLARAGTPIGVLLTRVLRATGHVADHYAVSIIRDRGIDRNALRHIAAHHDPADVVFVDGWTGKGAIAKELRASLADRPFGFAPVLAVVADPAGQADIAASDDDYLIASGLLNGIVSGLVSRSILRPDLVGVDDYHACVTYPQFAAVDRSRAFVDALTPLALRASVQAIDGHEARRPALRDACEAMVARLLILAQTADRNRIKPGIAEATRALLRRMPERLLVRDREDPDVAHLLHLAERGGVPVSNLGDDSRYRAVAIIRSLGKDA
ncbi:cysteine protease StiP domain-containing protein [Sphingomonas sp. CLY1604]|uniref:cysteine protease StiP domain-containing protein n=1 Tax=Sphingomonas sp. CLY1604 TaxID=3457786 RepID=UPI003FD7FF2D